MTFEEKQHEYFIRKGFWVLYRILKKVNHIDNDQEYTLEQANDLKNTLQEEIVRIWNAKVATLPDLKPDTFGDIMSVEVWLETVKTGGFIDYDGHGALAVDKKVSAISICPSDITLFKLAIPSWCTHIHWYNR